MEEEIWKLYRKEERRKGRVEGILLTSLVTVISVSAALRLAQVENEERRETERGIIYLLESNFPLCKSPQNPF